MPSPHGLRPVGLVENRGNGALHHIVGANLLPRSLLRVLSSEHRLFFALGSHFFPLTFACHEGELLRVRQLTLKISHERLDVDVLVTVVQHRADYHDGLAPFRLAEVVQPRIFERFLDHGLCHHAGVGVVPAAAQVGDDARVHTSHLGFRAAPSKSGDYHTQDRHPAASHGNVHHQLLMLEVHEALG